MTNGRSRRGAYPENRQRQSQPSESHPSEFQLPESRDSDNVRPLRPLESHAGRTIPPSPGAFPVRRNRRNQDRTQDRPTRSRQHQSQSQSRQSQSTLRPIPAIDERYPFQKHPIHPDRNHPSPSAPPTVKRSRSRKPSRKRQKSSSWQAIVLQGFIFSVALGLACGLIARRWGATLSTLPDVTGTNNSIASLAPAAFIAPSNPSIRPGSPISELNQALQSLDAEHPTLQLGAVLVDISQRNYAGLRTREVFPAASTIKLAVLVALLESIDRSEVTLQEPLSIQEQLLAGGSGTLKSQPPGTQVSVLEAAELMIVTSDNTATNLLIDRLGGLEVLNQRFQVWGLQHTQFHNLLPDLEGSNTTSPADLALMIGEVERGQILSMRSRDHFFDILQQTQNNTLLPQALLTGDRIAHKTGNIASSLGDVGLVDLPNGQRYIAAVFVKRENGDNAAEEVIRQVSSLARNYWGQ